ncbi:MAG: hypothetical protein QXL52_03135 [Nitrososphaerales archaeon]
MLKIELGDLKDKNEDLMAFLEKRLRIKPSMEGGLIVLNDTKSKVKLKKDILKVYLKRYLHINGLRKGYRVLVEGNKLRFNKLKSEERI